MNRLGDDMTLTLRSTAQVLIRNAASLAGRVASDPDATVLDAGVAVTNAEKLLALGGELALAVNTGSPGYALRNLGNEFHTLDREARHSIRVLNALFPPVA